MGRRKAEAGGGRPERRVRGREWVGVAEADAGRTSARQRWPCCPSGLGSCGLLIEIWFRLCPPLELCALKPPRLPCPAAPSALARPAAVSASGTHPLLYHFPLLPKLQKLNKAPYFLSMFILKTVLFPD